MKAAQAVSQSEVVVRTSEGREFGDRLAVEEPLEIRIGFPDGTHKAVSITMRTPGGDSELAAGFLFTEGIINMPDQIERIRNCMPAKAGTPNNTIRVDLNDAINLDLKRLERNFYMTSSCGICGKASIEALATGVKTIESGLTIDAKVVHSLSQKLCHAQAVFETTGGLHASALFNAEGTLDIVREDVGRHNALDKVIGAKFMANETPLSDKILLVSGRASFELVQKALMAGIPILAAVGAPSSLAVELAREYGMTLLGFVRDSRFNVYCGEQRVWSEEDIRNN